MQQSLSGGQQSFRLHQSATGPRCGWTLIDLLLVLSVLFVNVSLATPFILSIREGARKVQCLANVNRSGRPLNQYHEQHSRLPPGFTFSDNGPYGGMGWSQKILPQLGFTDLSARTGAHCDKRNAGVQESAANCCPSFVAAMLIPIPPRQGCRQRGC